MDWSNWHNQYDTTASLQVRLRIVREQISIVLHACPPGPIRLVSLCAGDGRDLVGAVKKHPRRHDVVAFLIDTDEESLMRGRVAAAEAGLERRLQFIQADAMLAAGYVKRVPADVLLTSGVLGHLRPEGVRSLIDGLAMLCRQGGWLVWNRPLCLNDGQRQVPALRQGLREAGWLETQLRLTSSDGFACGLCQFQGRTIPLDASRVLFEFVGLEHLAESTSEQAASVGRHQGNPLPARS